MSDTLDQPRPLEEKREDSFIVDGRYIREQADEAVALFLVPVSGIFSALLGRSVHSRRFKRRKAKKAA